MGFESMELDEETADASARDVDSGAPSSADEDGVSEGDFYEVRGSDPVVRWLVLAVFGVIVLWVVGLLSAVVFGVVSPPKAPRTTVERNLLILRQQVQAGAADTRTWARYVDALITAGQLSKARESIGIALQQAKADKSYLLAEQARLYLAAKDYSDAVRSADDAVAQADAERQAQAKANAARQITASVGLPESWDLAVLTKAQALVLSGDGANAVKTYDAYLEKHKTDADIIVRRGDAKAALGDTAGAAADYREALKFIPDYKSALDGLNRIGADKK
jgi:tetratricopeptide (TPR) repeat protein